MKQLLCIIIALLFVVNISYTQTKTIDVYVPNVISQSSSNLDIIIYRIHTDETGIINSITSMNDDTYIIPEIINADNNIRIWSNQKKYAINYIKTDNTTLYVKGGERSIYTRNGDQFMEIKIQPDNYIIYEHDEILLIKESDNVLENHFKINPSKYFGYNYSNNTLIVDYRYINNPNYKYVYEKNSGVIFVTYSYMMDEYIAYSPKIEIHGKIYSDEMKVNIINYFIITSVSNLLSSVLFPLFFLENPVS
jgi:hypothetical protein